MLRSRVKNFGTIRKILPQGMHVCNMKPLFSYNSNVVANVKFLLTDGQTNGDSFINPPPPTSFALGRVN